MENLPSHISLGCESPEEQQESDDYCLDRSSKYKPNSLYPVEDHIIVGQSNEAFLTLNPEVVFLIHTAKCPLVSVWFL